MKLWLLRPVENLRKGDNPWDPWYDKTFGFVVRAKTEDRARTIADLSAAGENRGMFLGRRISNTRAPWKDAKYSTCEVLGQSGGEGVIIEDNRQA